MVAADGTVIDHDVCASVRLGKRDWDQGAHPKPTAPRRSTEEDQEGDDKRVIVRVPF